MQWIFSLFLACICLAPVYACDVTDDTGHVLHLQKPAQRIISLAPDITEILFAIGAGERIVGVVDSSDYPQAARRIQRIGSYTGLDLERIVTLHPDLIVTWGSTFSRQLSALKNWGIPVYTTQPQHLQAIPLTMKNLGCLTGKEQLAQQAAEHFSKRLQALRQRYSQQTPLSVFYQIGPYALITINQNSWIHDVITLCGGRNSFANAKFIAPEISWEAVVVANPQVIISDATHADWRRRWQRWQTIAAVKNHFLFAVPPDLIDRAGPRLLDGAQQICEFLQQARAARIQVQLRK